MSSIVLCVCLQEKLDDLTQRFQDAQEEAETEQEESLEQQKKELEAAAAVAKVTESNKVYDFAETCSKAQVLS